MEPQWVDLHDLDGGRITLNLTTVLYLKERNFLKDGDWRPCTEIFLPDHSFDVLETIAQIWGE